MPSVMEAFLFKEIRGNEMKQENKKVKKKQT